MSDEIVSEEWRAVPGFIGYEVSNMGNVRSYKSRAAHLPNLLKKGIDSDGYEKVTLISDGKHFYRKVHRLVLEAFVGPCPKGLVARHFPDKCRTRNVLSNLSWGTQQENADDRVVHGTNHSNIGSSNAVSKLTENDIPIILAFLGDGWEQRFVAKLFGVADTVVSKIKCGNSWSHVSGIKRKHRELSRNP